METRAADRFITAKEAAGVIGCHPAQVTRRVQRGELVAIVDPRDRRKRLIEREAVEQILAPLLEIEMSADRAA